MKIPFKIGDKVVKKSGNSFESGARIAEIIKIEHAVDKVRSKVWTNETGNWIAAGALELAKTGEEPKVQTGTIQADSSLKDLVNQAMQKQQGEWTVARPESDHYHTGGVDVWQFADENFSQIEVEGFHRINAIKYLARYGKKNGYNRKDLEKAIVSIEKLIEIHDKER